MIVKVYFNWEFDNLNFDITLCLNPLSPHMSSYVTFWYFFTRMSMPIKKSNEKFAKVIFAKNKLFKKLRKFFLSMKYRKLEGNKKKSVEIV